MNFKENPSLEEKQILKAVQVGETRKYFMSLDGISALKNRTEHLDGYNIKATKYEDEGIYCEVLIIPNLKAR